MSLFHHVFEENNRLEVWEVWEMALSVKHLLHKHEDLSSILSTHVEKPSMGRTCL